MEEQRRKMKNNKIDIAKKKVSDAEKQKKAALKKMKQ